MWYSCTLEYPTTDLYFLGTGKSSVYMYTKKISDKWDMVYYNSTLHTVFIIRAAL